MKFGNYTQDLKGEGIMWLALRVVASTACSPFGYRDNKQSPSERARGAKETKAAYRCPFKLEPSQARTGLLLYGDF